MSTVDLIPSLLRDHARVRELLDATQSAGVSSAEGRRYLKQVHALLVEHMHRENVHLYPALRGCVATQALADTYAVDMKELSREILAFFHDLDGVIDESVLGRAFDTFLAAIHKRMACEETHIYPGYGAHFPG